MGLFRWLGLSEEKYQQDSKYLRELNVNQENSLFIFPFTLHSGFVDLTEHGEVVGSNVITDATNFERIWTGEDTGIAVWDNSTTATMKNGKIIKEYKVGDHFFGTSYESLTTSNIGASTFEDNFISQTTSTTFGAVIPADHIEITREDLLKVFIVPQLTSKWLRIATLRTSRDLNNKPTAYFITFETLDTKLGKSGKAIFQTIQKAAPGEGYAFPRLTEDRKVAMTKESEIDPGVDEVQIEILGNAILSGIACMGRPLDNTREIHKPRFLVPYKVKEPIETAIKKSSAPCSQITLVSDIKPTLQTQFKNWKQDNQSNYDWSVRKQFDGMFDTNHNATILSKLKDDSPWNPDLRHDFTNANAEVIDGRHSPYMRNSLTLNSGSKSIADLLGMQALGYTWVPQLPIEIKESVPRKVNDIPVIGKILGLFNFGNGGWTRTRKDMVLPKGFAGIMSLQQYKLSTEAMYDVGAGNKGFLPMEVFDNEPGSPIGKISGASATNLSFRFSLTDKMLDTSDNSTLNLEDAGTTLTHKVNANHVAAQSDSTKFAIDGFYANIIGKCDYIVSYFNNGVRVYSAKMQTTAKFTGNIRNWSNHITHSHWNSLDIVSNPNWKGVILNDLDYSQHMDLPFSQDAKTFANTGGDTIMEPNYHIDITKFDKYSSLVINNHEHTQLNIQGLANGEHVLKDFSFTFDGIEVPGQQLILDKQANYVTIAYRLKMPKDKWTELETLTRTNIWLLPIEIWDITLRL